MREIKFRAWHKPSQTMRVVTSLFFSPDGALKSFGGHWPNNVWPKSLSELELMQYTGLKDKNGREIYEGDIVKAELYRSYLMPHEHNPQVLEVAHEEDMTLSPFHTLVGYDGERWANVLVDGFEVIGNIYENPELLKEA